MYKCLLFSVTKARLEYSYSKLQLVMFAAIADMEDSQESGDAVVVAGLLCSCPLTEVV